MAKVDARSKELRNLWSIVSRFHHVQVNIHP